MSEQQLSKLFERWNGGDESAFEEVFLAYEPYLRMVVRRQLSDRLRSKFDSVDVVQTVWADVLKGLKGPGMRFKDPGHLRAFLVRLTRNRFVDFCRQYRGPVEHERPMSESSAYLLTSQLDQPSQVVQADETWALVMSVCPPAHHRLLELKGQGRSPVEIAAMTGLHAGSVRRILADLAVRYEALEAGGGSRAPRP